MNSERSSTAYLVAGVRTPFGRYGGALAPVRPDDLGAHVVGALTRRLPSVDWSSTTRSQGDYIKKRSGPSSTPGTNRTRHRRHRLLHVIIGDANMSEVSTYLKLGTTALVLAMIEDKFLGGDLSVESPVAQLRAISHDPTCRYQLTAIR